jgi:hypothetical protein
MSVSNTSGYHSNALDITKKKQKHQPPMLQQMFIGIDVKKTVFQGVLTLRMMSIN